MAIKILFGMILGMTTLAANAEYLASAEQHVLPALERANCRLSVPSRLVSQGHDNQLERFAVYPLRPELAAEFCQKGELIEVDPATAQQLRDESVLYTNFMTLAVNSMADESQLNRGDVSRDDTFFRDQTVEVFNYQLAGLFQGDKCQVQSDKALRVVGFLGPKGVLVRYENDVESVDKSECPKGTIILVGQADLISRV